MVQLGLTLKGVSTALDLEEGLLFLDHQRSSVSSAARDASTVADELLIPIAADTDVVTAGNAGGIWPRKPGSRAGIRR